MGALVLFCGAGGAARGLQQAGFHVTGIDIKKQPRYAGDLFIHGNALNSPVKLEEFDFIWASPPCQAYSALKGLVREKQVRLVPLVREMLTAAERLWVIENVVGSDLRNPIELCGSMFGLGVWRHRLFEMSNLPMLTPECRHSLCPKPIDVTGTGGPFHGKRKTSGGGISRKPDNVAHAAAVMGIDWMTREEMSQAIPPVYSKFIGRAAMQYLQAKAA